jgi:group I intron endonuclease
LKGIYGFFCKNDNKLYVGSSENLVKRFNEYIKNQKSNIKLQRAILKYGLNNFYYIVFEFYNLKDKVLLIDIETIYLSSFKIEYLYNFKLIAHSLLSYKHTVKAKQKMLNRYSKYQYPFLGKHHTMKAKWKISLATKGINNPMFGKKHKKKSKN